MAESNGLVPMLNISGVLAEREGFEPSIEFPLYALSKRAPSASRTPLHMGLQFGMIAEHAIWCQHGPMGAGDGCRSAKERTLGMQRACSAPAMKGFYMSLDGHKSITAHPS